MKRRKSSIGLVVSILLAVLALLATGSTPANADVKADAQGIVDKARVTLDAFMRHKDYVWLQENLKHAKEVLIYPQVLKAGFILGGSGGTGVFLANDQKTGEWSQPAFYTVGSVTFGLQIGGEAAETVILAMSRKAVDSLYTSSAKLGGDTSIALGPVGAGAKANLQIGNGLVNIIDKEGMKFYFEDYDYAPVRFEWLEQYVLWWKEAIANFGIAYANDAFDCENFARLFKAMLDVQIIPIELKESKSIASATVLVYPEIEFGGIGPESGTHVLNLVGTDRGWIIVEPQTGAMNELPRYPNLKYVIGIAFG